MDMGVCANKINTFDSINPHSSKKDGTNHTKGELRAMAGGGHDTWAVSVCICAGAPFVKGAWIGWVVFLNGAVTHLTSAFGWRHCDYVRIVDTTTNVALC